LPKPIFPLEELSNFAVVAAQQIMTGLAAKKLFSSFRKQQGYLE